MTSSFCLLAIILIEKKIVRISEFVPISEITLIQWDINYKKFELLEY